MSDNAIVVGLVAFAALGWWVACVLFVLLQVAESTIAKLSHHAQRLERQRDTDPADWWKGGADG